MVRNILKVDLTGSVNGLGVGGTLTLAVFLPTFRFLLIALPGTPPPALYLAASSQSGLSSNVTSERPALTTRLMSSSFPSFIFHAIMLLYLLNKFIAI